MPWIAGCVISAALLWLGPEIGAAARTRNSRLGWGLYACAGAVGACGLWWPGHLAALGPPASASHGTIAALAWLVALGLTLLVGVTAGAALRRNAGLFAALCIVTLVVTYGHSMLALPGLFGAVAQFAPWAPGATTVVLAVALVWLHLHGAPSPRARWSRTGAAVVIAAMLVAASSTSAPSGIAGVAATLWPEALMMAGLVLTAAVLVAALHAAGHAEAETTRRAHAPPAPTVDSLTQLPTRLYFENHLAGAAAKADAKSGRLALLFIDLDGFK
ncbi:MAG: diguanylate cyclase domain-containing protein, partial [Caldimonas sp.]